MDTTKINYRFFVKAIITVSILTITTRNVWVADTIEKFRELIEWKKHSQKAINIYLVPYLGETFQGMASPAKKLIYLGQFSDKATGSVSENLART